MFGKQINNKLGVVQKTNILLKLLEDPQSIEQFYSELSAPQMQKLRDLVERQVLHFSYMQDGKPLTPPVLKKRYEPVPNYYHKQYCREPLEACYNETCMASNPSCFSKKMTTQIAVALKLVEAYLAPGGDATMT